MKYADSNNSDILQQQASRESNARSYPRSLPLAIDEAQGVHVVDMDGNTYYDCLAGAGTLALGHNHPKIVEVLERWGESHRAMHTLDISTPTKEQFVDSLLACFPDDFSERAKVQFCSPAGTDAVEAAIKLAKTATQNRSVLAFQGAYHGMTNGSLSLTGNTDPKGPLSGLMPDVHHLPFPSSYRCPFGVGGDESHRIASQYVENLLTDSHSGISSPAAMILEPVQGEGGAIPAPAPWLREIRRITREREIPLIVDEIQTGLGRTGKLFGFEHANIQPDIVTLSKAIGGSLPLAVVVYDESLDVWEPGAHAGTFRGNNLAMATGKATIEYVLENDLDERAAQLGDRLRDHLEAIAETCEAIGEVRGRGLMQAVEFVDRDVEWKGAGPHAPDPRSAEAVQLECFDRGLIVECGGRENATIRFLPPLIISKQQIDDVASIFEEAVETVAGGTI